ncbi:AraC-like DNA-binding protein [Arcticibacter pallidicorallinus]|uniref:AraC-like DNA-binding protein n=1 Tax=Arcticibacter pallidicorallinus TaxID=1259464 RepID=A0A2T0U3W5_9SPHI|nr:helix-turn-helix domain-containing protein [Arcticibacter pallidicorallinus]PRY52591.1 AraC-like DNA-binding protein [Arcticibacter pallidicorallinus]
MKAPELIKTDDELFRAPGESLANSANINIMELSSLHLKKQLNTTVYLRSSMFILVLSGTCAIEINFRRYEVSTDEIILLSFGHFFKISHLSEDLRCIVLYVSKGYIDDMFSTDMVYKRIKYGVRMHRKPHLTLNNEEAHLLHQRLQFIQGVVLNEQHRYHKEMILASLLFFFLDLSNIIEKDERDLLASQPSRDEIYFQQFLEQLVLHYKSQHHVDFYAEKLHITTHYLTLIVKRVSGQTVTDLIFQLLFSEAKLLLQQPRFSVQQVAEELHFSDQSAFGKFFKRKSGTSPKEFALKAKNQNSI